MANRHRFLGGIIEDFNSGVDPDREVIPCHVILASNNVVVDIEGTASNWDTNGVVVPIVVHEGTDKPFGVHLSAGKSRRLSNSLVDIDWVGCVRINIVDGNSARDLAVRENANWAVGLGVGDDGSGCGHVAISVAIKKAKSVRPWPVRGGRGELSRD